MTLSMTKITSSRIRTRRRSTPATSLRSPPGKNAGSTARHWCSTAKKTSAAVTVPATHVMPKISRSEPDGVKNPQRTGYSTPQAKPAPIQPANASAANM